MTTCGCGGSNAGELKDILNFAIEREQEAVDFYYELAGRSKVQGIKDELTKFAKMEEGHRDKLKSLDISGIMGVDIAPVTDLKIVDYMVEPTPTPDMTWQDILNIAMKRELASMNMYNDLAAKSKSDSLRQMFLSLAQEESKHKLYFETIYDDEILREN